MAAAILVEARKVEGVDPFLTRLDMSHRGGEVIRYRRTNNDRMRQLVHKLPFSPSASFIDDEMGKDVQVRLSSHWPDEFELVTDMLWSYTRNTEREVANAVTRLSQAEIDSIFAAYLGNRSANRRLKPGRAIERAHTTWEITGDYGTFRDLQRHRMVDGWEWQLLTADHGFDVPEMVIEAGQEHNFQRCFELSRQLYRQLLDRAGPVVAQYATLLGHRMRYRFTINLREAFHMLELRTGPDGHPGYRAICQEMHRQLSHAYPRLAAAMIHIGQREPEALGRLDKAKLDARRQTK